MNKKAVCISMCVAFFALSPTAFAGQYNSSMNSNYWSSNSIGAWNSNYQYQGGSSSRSGNLFETDLSGKQEVPAAPDIVSGNAGVWFGENGKDMNYWLSAWSEKEKLTAAHIHCGDPGENGPAVVTLFNDAGKKTGGEIGRGYLNDNNVESGGASCDDVIGYEVRNLSDLSRAISEGKAYVNLHSQNYPNGVARGQFGTQNSNLNNWNNQSANQNNWWWNNYSSSSPWQTGSTSSWSQSGASSYANTYAQSFVAGANAYANSSASASAYSSSGLGNWGDQFWRSW